MKKIVKINLFIFCLLTIFPLFACKSQEKTIKNVYDLSVVLNEDMSLDCTMFFTFNNTIKDGLDSLKFTLYPNAFSKDSKIKPVKTEYFLTAYENGLSYGNVQIKKVKENDKDLTFSVGGEDNNTLEIKLNDKLKLKESIKILIEFKVVLPNVLHRFGYSKNTINLTGFYPILCVYEKGNFVENVYYSSGDPFYSDCADYLVSLKVPSKYVVASSLNAKYTICLNEYTRYDYYQESVRDIAFILSDKFNVIKKEVNGVSLYYYYYDDLNAEDTMQTIKKSLAFFSSKFCNYPYKTYSVCQADFIYGGMEYPCLTFIDSSLEGINKDYTIVHETAHEWWYGLVGVNQTLEGYIDEGLTEYSTSLFFKKHSEYKLKFEDIIEKTKLAYLEIRKSLARENSDIKPNMLKSLKDYDSDLDYVSINYYRSQIMFHKLNQSMGEKKFIKCLRYLLDTYKYKNIDTNILKKTFEKYKKGTSKIITSFIDGTAVV